MIVPMGATALGGELRGGAVAKDDKDTRDVKDKKDG